MLSRAWSAPLLRWALRAVLLAVYAVAGVVMVAGQDMLTKAARLDPELGLFPLPRGLGVWPAALALAGFAWLELVQPDRATLPVLRVWALVWLLGAVIGSVVVGRRWIGASDPFEVYATAVSQLSWVRADQGGQRDHFAVRLRAVNPLHNLAAWQAPPGTSGVVSVLLGSTAFDSFQNTTWWIRTIQSADINPTGFATVGLITMILSVLGLFSLACWAMKPWVDGVRLVDLPRQLASTVVPIVIGYAVAHYCSFLVVVGQQSIIQFSDPLGEAGTCSVRLSWGRMPASTTIRPRSRSFSLPRSSAATSLASSPRTGVRWSCCTVRTRLPAPPSSAGCRCCS